MVLSLLVLLRRTIRRNLRPRRGRRDFRNRARRFFGRDLRLWRYFRLDLRDWLRFRRRDFRNGSVSIGCYLGTNFGFNFRRDLRSNLGLNFGREFRSYLRRDLGLNLWPDLGCDLRLNL